MVNSLARSSFPPTVTCADETITNAWTVALGDLRGNILPRHAGLLAEPRPVIAAGMHYPQLWLRDAAVNAWNAGSLVASAEAGDGLLAVVERGEEGYNFPHPDYYDGVVWISGAWHHACVTGDAGFLRQAFDIARDALARFRREEFAEETELYRGGSFFNDGVSGYPGFYARPSGPYGNILDCLRDPAKRAPSGRGLLMHCLSTNCLYLLGLRAAAAMARVLDEPDEVEWTEQAERLHLAIRKHFWNPDSGRLAYLVDARGTDFRQEIGGWAFACLAGVLDASEQARLAEQVERLQNGTPSLWPTYERYAQAGGLGRHSGLVWPHVLAFWGDACARRGDAVGLERELRCLAEAATRHGNFTECWHPTTGEPDGGLQERDGALVAWASFHRTTWGATGYLRLFLQGVAGLRPEWDRLNFEPCLPEGLGPVRFEGLHWRGTEFSIELRGAGSRLSQITINGVPFEQIALAPNQAEPQEIAAVLSSR